MGIYDKGQLRGAYSVGYEAGVKAGADAMRDLRDQCGALREAITLTLEENAHLADGDVCTLSRLKDALQPNAKSEPTSAALSREVGSTDGLCTEA